MHADALRRILLVKSVEDHDADGAVLTQGEREAATREAVRAHPATETSTGRDTRTWRVLDRRASELYQRLVQRHPVVGRTMMLESHASQASLLVLLVAFACGVVLSLVDSRVRIEILAFPLLGVVLWNLAVYLVLAIAALRRRPKGASANAGAPAGWVAWPLRWGWRRAAALVRQASFYHRPLAAALRRFADDWWPHAQPLMAVQGKRVFHVAAAALAIGLVAGLYVRGIALEYRAGWESTFLTPGQVRTLLHALYGPASAVTGIALPEDDAAIDALHWRGGSGGGPAAPWIHLSAATALLFVVLPRLLLAAWSWISLARLSRSLTPPDALLPYARGVLGASDAAPAAASVRVTPYAYRPDRASLAGLNVLLQATHGPGTQLDFGEPIAYGSEDDLRSRPVTQADVDAVLFTLAATPEAENHGAVLVALRDALARARSMARLLVIVDETPFVAHARGDASFEARVEERRGAWREFVARHGAEACIADLGVLGRVEDVPPELVGRLRASARPVLA
jgi:hypothetical protein